MSKLFAIAVFFVIIGVLGVAGITLGFGTNSSQPVVEAGFGWDGPSPSPSPAP